MTIREHTADGVHSWALYSPCERYRYVLSRAWSAGPQWLFIGCNPSTATELDNDPTIERMQRRAVHAGAGSLVVVNCYALRSTNPRALLTADDPNGERNDAAIRTRLSMADIVVCGWGNHRALRDRAPLVMEMIKASGQTPMAFAINKDGSPKHPLYIGYERRPMPMDELQCA